MKREKMTTENAKINTNECESFISVILKDLGMEVPTPQKKKRKQNKNENQSKGHILEGGNNKASTAWSMVL